MTPSFLAVNSEHVYVGLYTAPRTCHAQHYTGDIAPSFGTRIKEHLSCSQALSTINEHKLSKDHQCTKKDI